MHLMLQLQPQYALAVVYPQAGNIGGGGFMVATTADGKTVVRLP